MPKLKPNQPLDLPQYEADVLSWWKKTKAFEKSVEQRSPDKSYVFYDGPPFATGMPHYGHLLASTTKDAVPRYWTMRGYRVERVWGWDCHGLPIENMIEGQLGIEGGKLGIEKLGIAEFNQACRSEVLRLDKEWEKIIGRLGRWVDFDGSYKTMDASFMESVWWGFKQLNDKNLIYEGKRVIMYCPRCSTPLSNFEIAMDNSYQQVEETATTYKYQIEGEKNTFLLAWSTTPWNKLATPALAVHPDKTYAKVKQGEEFLILLESRLSEILKPEPKYEVVDTFTGEELAKQKFELHYDFYPERLEEEVVGVIVTDDFVTEDEGTGVVTLAVYGEDDFRVMQKESVQLIEHVTEEGKLKPEVKPWAGLDILDANPSINQDLEKRGLIYQDQPHVHSVAACYRCGTRLYYAPVPAWFVDVQQLKEKLVEHNQTVNWYPDHLRDGRFGKGLENAPDWNISRSRYWGTPMPVWRGKKGDQVLTRIIGSIDELKKWAVDPDQLSSLEDIHREFLDPIEVWVDDDKTVVGHRIPEVFDCWVESGSMPFASLHYPFENKDKFERNYPAQFVSEYIAQTRAWFYTMHVISVGVFGKPSFENVLTTGTILAEDGSKMSKSKKNYPDPMLLVDKYGVDSLRLYLLSSTVMKGENLNFSESEVADINRRVFNIWWNVYKFYDLFANKSQPVNVKPKNPTHSMDKWLLSRVESLIRSTTEYMDNYDVIRASRQLMEFVDELSTWYLRLSRDRLRADDSLASHVFGYAIYTLGQLMAPLAPYFPEIIHHQMVDDQTSIHHTDWPQAEQKLVDGELEKEMGVLKDVVNQARALRKEAGVKLKQPLSKLEVKSSLKKVASDLTAVIAQELNVKKIVWSEGEQLTVSLDLELTPELEAEGQARELMSQIQKLRRQAGLKQGQAATVAVPNWPQEWQTKIEERTSTKLIKGDELRLQ